MNTLTITVSNKTVFDKIIVGAHIRIVSFIWGSDLHEWKKNTLLDKLRGFLFNILQKYRNIKVLDLSHLDGLKEAYYPANFLEEIYYPDSIEAVSYYKNKTLKKISARGAKSIMINQVPTLECIEYGPNLKELSLKETGIVHIDIPQNVKLSYSAFKGCEKLESVILRSGTDVPPYAFEECSNLYEVTLPDDLLVIEPYVFKGCKKLQYVLGGKNVKQVFPSAFKGCFNLEMMECKNFYRFTDLKISDKYWMDIFRPYKPSIDIKKELKNFAKELTEKDVEKPEEYIAENFFHETEYHFGFVMEYQFKIRGWMVWSLSHSHFIATKGSKYNLSQDDLVTFSIERKPTITIKDSLYFQHPMVYIEDASALKKIEHGSEESDGYEYFLEYFKPRISLLEHYKKITQTIDALDIHQIIDSYSIKTSTWWQTRPGRDDFQFYERIAKSNYSDNYLNTLMPQENYKDYDSGGSPLDFDEEEENRKMQESADAEAKSIIENAHNHYSKEAHICKLLEDIINKRRKLEKDIESKYHIQAIKDFIHCRFVDYGEGENSLIEFYGYSLEDILKDQKYNEQVSWSYKHGWVKETEDSNETEEIYK